MFLQSKQNNLFDFLLNLVKTYTFPYLILIISPLKLTLMNIFSQPYLILILMNVITTNSIFLKFSLNLLILTLVLFLLKTKLTLNATLPQGLIGYIEIPTTNTKPSYYRVYDVNTLVHSLVHSYCPDITEPVPPPRNQSLPPSIKVTPDTFTVNTLQPSTPVNNKFTPPPLFSRNTQIYKQI